MKLNQLLTERAGDQSLQEHPSVVYKVSLTAAPEVYYGYMAGDHSQQTLDKIKKQFISGRTIDEDPKNKDRGDRRMLVAAGNNPNNLEFEIIEELPNEAQAKDARNDFRNTDPNTVTRGSSWPIRGISGQILSSDPTFSKKRKLKKESVNMTAEQFAHASSRLGDHSVSNTLKNKLAALSPKERFQFTADMSGMKLPAFMQKYFANSVAIPRVSAQNQDQYQQSRQA